MRAPLLALPVLCLFLADATATGQPATPASQSGQMMLTVFLRHDQSKPLGEIRAELEKERLLPEVPAGRGRDCFLVRDDGHRPGGHLALPCRAAPRREPGAGAERLGRVPDRLLPDVRLQAGRRGRAEEGQVALSARGATSAGASSASG